MIDGRRYRWERIETARYGDPLPWERICALLGPPRGTRPHRVTEHSVDGLVGWLARQEPGNRNAALHWAACRAVDGGHYPEQLRPSALAIGLTEREINATLASAQRSAA